ncbi:MAG: chitobiase/beta-hexosaminidase C-terminal domain-containing protein [Pseudomonadota bacterium]
MDKTIPVKQCPAIPALVLMLSGWILLLAFQTETVMAEDSVCARVKIEIKQELALERQAFDAHMIISNDLTHLAIEDVSIEVWFADDEGNLVHASSDPDDLDALFFIRVDSMDTIDNISGSGIVAPETSADIHWLIIPAPGASNGLEQGTRYSVGATLTYTMGGQSETTRVSPDYIFVKPMPELVIDYFIPSLVYGDDPFTNEIEPSIPFSLGVRVKNGGAGRAVNLSIDSAQPKIVENDQGLLINFVIDGTEVNGQEIPDSLCIDFGTLAPGSAAVARWIMACSLSGRFVEFKADFSHSDELGGALTSLIQSVNEHFLVHDVQVDVPGRDEIRDFLARDDDVYRLYESDSETSLVTDLSMVSSLVLKSTSGSRNYYTLNTQPVAGPSLVTLSDPYHGSRLLSEAVRSDGKVIKPANVWQSKIQDGDTHTWSHYINLFDANGTDVYTLVFDSTASVPQAPILQYIPDRSRQEGQQISFLVEASDPNGTLPSLGARNLPAGASFVDNGDGTGVFDWTPGVGQNGIYTVVFTASDGQLSDTAHVRITISDAGDSDMDGIPDSWELLYFGTLDRDGLDDSDNDGIPDLQEWLNGTDPLVPDSAPGVPEPVSPFPSLDVTDLTPTLVVKRPPGYSFTELFYEFQIFGDESMTHLVAAESTPIIPESETQTSWTLPMDLKDNHLYYWRVRAFNSTGCSLWAYSSFFLNMANDPPEPFFISFPADGAQVDTVAPALEVTSSNDPDFQSLEYRFEVYADDGSGLRVATAENITSTGPGFTSWTVTPPLSDTTWYFWRATATDEEGSQTATADSYFQVNTTNRAPSIPDIVSPVDGGEIQAGSTTLAAAHVTDPDNDPVVFLFEIDTCATFDNPGKLSSGPIPQGQDATLWQINDLDEDTAYWWRVRTSDGNAASSWARARFFVNQADSAPPVPGVRNPGSTAWVHSLTPELSVHPVEDPDRDGVTYRFELYGDEALSSFIAQADTPVTQWTVPGDLSDHTRYYWRVQAVDETGTAGPWSPALEFFIDRQVSIDQTPPQLTISPPGGEYCQPQTITLAADEPAQIYYTLDGTDPDPNANPYDGPFLVDSASTLNCIGTDTAGNTSEMVSHTYTFSPCVLTVHVASGSGAVFGGIEVLVYDGAGEFTDILAVTDSSGNAVFDSDTVIPGDYTFRVDYRGGSFSSPVIRFPDTLSATITIPTQIVDVSVLAAGFPVPDIQVHLYTESRVELGVHQVTDTNGHVQFELPTDTGYTFRTDILGYPYWSGPVTPIDGSVNRVDLNAGGGRLTILVQTDTDTSIPGLVLHLNNAGQEPLGPEQTTGQDGKAFFDVPEGDYTIAMEYLGYQFLTDVVSVAADTSIIHTLIHTESTIGVSLLFQGQRYPLPGLAVNLFTQAGEATGRVLSTDTNGQVVFSLPDRPYRVMVDYLGRQYGADITPGPETRLNMVSARAVVSVTEAGLPLAGTDVHLLSGDGIHLDYCCATDTQGQAQFILPAGGYQFQVEYDGKLFTSAVMSLAADETFPVGISVGGGEFTVSVTTDQGDPVPGVECHVCTPDQQPLGISGFTNPDGQVYFNLSDGTYLIRADYMDGCFWAGPVRVPDLFSIPITIAHEPVSVTVTMAVGPVQNATVYLCSGLGTFLGQSALTNAYGQVYFDLPTGLTFRFKVDISGVDYWSRTVLIEQGSVNSIVIDAGGGVLDVSVKNSDNRPLPGVDLSLFTENRDPLSLHQVTDKKGKAEFTVPRAVYTVRADWLGHGFWSDTVAVFSNTSIDMILPYRDTEVTVSGTYQGKDSPVVGADVCLCTESGTCFDLCQVSDKLGTANFFIPDRPYRFQAQYMGNHFWSDLSDKNQCSIHIPMAEVLVSVTNSGSTGHGNKKRVVTVFTASGIDLGIRKTIIRGNSVSFRLPAGDYRFRVDYVKQQFWSGTQTFLPDIQTQVIIPLE